MKTPWTVLRLYAPADTVIEADQLEQVLTVIWGKLSRPRFALTRQRVAFEVRGDQRGVSCNWVVPAEEARYVATILTNTLPGVAVDVVEDYMRAMPAAGRAFATLTVKPTRRAAYALGDFTPDFMRQLLGQMEEYRASGQLTVQVMMRPVLDGAWHPQARRDLMEAEGKLRPSSGAVSVLTGVLGAFMPSWFGAEAERPVVTRAERLATRETPKKLLSHGFDVQLRLMATADKKGEAYGYLQRMAGLFPLLDGANHLRPRWMWAGWIGTRRWERWSERESPLFLGANSLILTPAELASLVYPAPRDIRTEEGVRVIELQQPPLAEGLYLCDAQYRGQRVPVRVTPLDLDQHVGIFGETGTGKGVLLENVVREAARLDMGALYIDPKGNSAKKILASIPEPYLDRIVYIEAGHPRWAIPLNLLRPMSGADANSVTRMAVDLFAKLWESGWGFSTQEHLTAATRAAVDMGGSLPDAELFLADSNFRQRNLDRVQNASIRAHLANLPEKVSESVRPPLNKLHELLWTDDLLAMIGQLDTLDWQQLIRNRMIVLVNCNKNKPSVGKLGSRLIGSIIWSQMAAAAAAVGADARFLMIADELADVVRRGADDFKDGMIQFRQDQKPLFGAGQFPAQLPADVYDAMIGAGSKILLRQDGKRSDTSRDFMGPVGLQPGDLGSLPNLAGYANVLMKGRKTGLFTCWAPPFSQRLRDPNETAERLLARWGRPYAQVLDEIAKRTLVATGGAGPRPLE